MAWGGVGWEGRGGEGREGAGTLSMCVIGDNNSVPPRLASVLLIYSFASSSASLVNGLLPSVCITWYLVPNWKRSVSGLDI